MNSLHEFYSHRGVLLKEHLKSVGELCRKYASVAGDEIAELAELVGKSHDVGKYTSYFQKHLAGEKVGGDLSKHSYLSALIASWVITQRLKDGSLKDPLLPAIGFACVYSHHGDLISFSRLSDVTKGVHQDKVLFKQVESIKRNLSRISGELEEIGLSEVVDFVDNFERHVLDVSNELKRAPIRLLGKDENERWRTYYYTLLVFSSLIDADRRDAGGVKDTSYAKIPPSDIVIRYIKEKFPSDSLDEMSVIRRSIFQEAVESLDEILKSGAPSVITITAPTGSGKTLLGLYVALQLGERLNRGRVIYSLPYINIIEQTHTVVEDLMKTCWREPSVFDLLKHHHLTLPALSRADEGMSLDELLLLADAWDSGIIITTFEQLLRSIIGSRSSLLRRLHNIAGSVIILDEVQAIPLEYWKLVRDALLHLAKYLDVNIILMTATMPAIFREAEGRGGTAELVVNRGRYFKQLKRITLYPHLEGMSAEEFINFFLSKWKRGSSALIVLNTIKTSKRVYRELVKRLGDEAIRIGRSSDDEVSNSSKVILAYLSTSVLPIERERRIRLLRNLLDRRRSVILVSTQVVEAGVDLDFDIAFRDLGPLDSIVQVAGRCNRNNRLSEGRVFVVKIVDEDGMEDSKKIYGRILPQRTESLLKDKNALSERELYELIDLYYKDISYRTSTKESDKLLGEIEKLDFEELKYFSLIEEEPKVPVYVEYGECANDVLSKLNEYVEELKEEKDLKKIFELKAELRKLRVELEKCVVEVYRSEKSLGSLEQTRFGVMRVPRHEAEKFYDPETGFRAAEDERSGPAVLW